MGYNRLLIPAVLCLTAAAQAPALDHYRSGGRRDAVQDPLIRGFELSPQGRTDLIAFLESLTDTELLRDPRLSDPRK